MPRKLKLALVFLLAGFLPAFGQAITAKAELDDAIAVLKAYHVNRAKVDWPTLELQAQEMIEGKTAASDAYPAIRHLILQLGEKHTALRPADIVKALETDHAVAGGLPPRIILPEGHLLQGNIGLIALPAYEGSPSDDIAYTQAARDAVQRFADKGICRFIIDLRVNGGGNMYPMINGVEDLLGPPPYGYWQVENQSDVAWAGTNGRYRPAAAGNALASASALSQRLAGKSVVAVLVGAYTGSAGEDTAIAFEGRPRTRIFGEPTSGFLTANMAHRLPDGALLAVSDAWLGDRLHRPYRSKIVPDELTAKGQATFDAATAWLTGQTCK